MNLSFKYYQRLLSIVLIEYNEEFLNAKAGHCMKITGLALTELQFLCSEINKQYPNLKTYILSDTELGDLYISATKLIELRNDLSFPLLILIPSNSRTSAEDSYGNATFKNLAIQHLDEKLLIDLKKEVPVSVKNSVFEVFDYLKPQRLRTIQYINFLLEIESKEWTIPSIGRALHHLFLIPDSALVENSQLIRQRLLYNIKSIEILGDFSHNIPQRIADLPIKPKSIQKEIVNFLRSENQIKNKSEICFAIADRFQQLDFTNWPILDMDTNYDLQIIFNKFTSKDLKTSEGDFKFTIPSGKSIKIRLQLSTKPAPNDFKELKNFHVVLMAIDGWSQVLDIKKTKVTGTGKSERIINIDLSENLIEEGSYFFRVFGEDENGALLNTNNAFKDPNVEEEWLNKHKASPQLTRDDYQITNQLKYTSDSDDFYIKIGEAEELDVEYSQRKDKLNNVLEAFFRFRIEELRKGNELNTPKPIDDSGVWLNETQSTLVATYHIKYSSGHNYQINISSKLRSLEKCLIKHRDSIGNIEAVLGNNPIEPTFQSLRFNTFSGNHLVSKKLLNLRKELFEAIANSAPNNEGVFETFDIFNHIVLAKNYIAEYQAWGAMLNEKLEQKDFTNEEQRLDVQNLLIELQNLDIITIKTKLPDGQDVIIKLISPLHPLRLAWFINLFDLYANWEERTQHTPSYNAAWFKNLENLFLGDLLPEIGMTVLADSFTFDFFQYIGELSFGWGIYSKPLFQEKNVLSSVSRQLKIFVSSLLNIANEYRIDTDVNKILVGRHIRNYLIQHPYTQKLIINLFNAGDAYVFTSAFTELEKLNEFKDLKYELRLFADETIVEQGEALKNLINPETAISEDAEAFSQASGNRLFPKLRFSIKQISDFINKPADYNAHISFLISPFPVKTSLVRPVDNKKSFFFNGLINKQIISVLQKNTSITWSKYFVARNNISGNFTDISTALFDNIQSYVAHSLSANKGLSVPATCLELNETEKVLLSFIHDISDWVVTFDKNMGPEVYDLPGKEGEIPFLLDYVPGREIYGISSYLTTRPTTEIIGLLGPHFAEYNIDIRNDENKLKILLEDLRTISSSLIMQFNSTENKAFEVLGTAFTKRVLEKKRILNEAFLIPIDLHKELFENLPRDNKSRADNLLIKINPEKKEISITVIEIKCRTSLNESERIELVEKMQDQIENTIEALSFHFDTTYNTSADRLDRELKTLEFKSLLEFYLNRASRYNYLTPEIQFAYLNFLDNIDEGYSLKFKRLGIIYNFSATIRHKKEIYSNDAIFFTFGGGLIDEILDPESDLNTQRLEHVAEEEEFVNFFEKKDISQYIQKLLEQKKTLHDPEIDLIVEKTTEVKSPELIVPIINNSDDEDLSESKPENITDVDNYESPNFDIIVGKTSDSAQYGILGKIAANKKSIALDLSETNTISLFGVQGGGKSYSIGTITEMVLKQFNQVNLLPAPLAGVIFHYSESMDYEPEFTSMIYPNDKIGELQKLKDEFGASPDKLDDVILLTPRDKVLERKAQYPSIEVHPITFHSKELNVQDWMFLLGAIGNDSTYIKQLKAIMKGMRTNITLSALQENVSNSTLLTNNQKTLAEQRILFAKEYIDDNSVLRDLLKPGRLIIVDLRDEFIEKDEALGLFVVMLNIFSSIKAVDGAAFNKFIVFDEAHKYMDNKDLTGSIVTAIREMRHKGVSIMIASQDPPSLPNEIIELSSIVLLHKFNSPQWLKHIQKSITPLSTITPSDLSSLNPGEGFLWATKSTDKGIMNKPVKIFTRPRVTKHGGETIKAV